MKQLLALLLLLVTFSIAPAQSGTDPGNMVVTNRQSGTTYTVKSSDRNRAVVFTNAGTKAVSLPIFSNGWYAWFYNNGAGAATITPVSGTIGGSGTLVLAAGASAKVVRDSTGYVVTQLDISTADRTTLATPVSAGGSNTQVQYNNSGVFGGITGATTNGTKLILAGPDLGTPASGVATNLTGLPISSGLTGAGTGVLTALGVNVGSAGAPVLFNGAGGTPSSLVGTNITGTAAGLTAGGNPTGSGTLNTIPKFTPNGTTFGDSHITDTGSIIIMDAVTTYLGDGNGDSQGTFIYINDPTEYIKIVAGNNGAGAGADKIEITGGSTHAVNLQAVTTAGIMANNIPIVTISDAQTLTNKKLGNLTTNGLVTTSSSDGTLSVTVPGSGVLTFLGTPSGANLASALTTALPVSKGGTNCTAATITCFNNITGFSAAGTTGTPSTSLVFSTSPTVTTPVIASGLTASGSGANTFGSSTGTFVTSTGANTISGAVTFNSTLSMGGTALTFGALPSGATTAGALDTYAPQTYTVTGTNTATAFQGTYHGVVTVTDASAGTVTDLFGENWAGPAAVAGSLTGTRKHTLGVLDSTSAASSITGALIVAATYGTTATSVGIGGGNINAGGTGTFGGNLSVSGNILGAGGSSGVQAGTSGYISWASSKAIMSSPADGTILFQNSSANAWTSFQLGGTTSSFPMIKRNTTAINFRLADDSADAAITAAGVTASGAMINSGITTDAAHTDTSVCQDSTTHQFYSGSGTLGVCLGTSSARFKPYIADLPVGLAQIMALRPVQYRLDAQHGDPHKLLYGFTAEQGGSILPDLMERDVKGNPNTFDYLGIVPILVRAIQEQQKQIDELKARQ